VIFFLGSILSLSFVSLFVPMPEVPILQSYQRMLIPVTLLLIPFAFMTASVRRLSGSSALPGSGPIPPSRPPLVT
jgi:hypothetical protein